jgi:hypothetical protein
LRVGFYAAEHHPAYLKRAKKSCFFPPTASLEQAIHRQGDSAPKDRLKAAQAETPRFPQALKLEHVVDERRPQQLPAPTEFIDKISSFVDSGDLFLQRQLTINDLKDYAKRTYHRAPTTDLMASASDHAAANRLHLAGFQGSLGPGSCVAHSERSWMCSVSSA